MYNFCHTKSRLGGEICNVDYNVFGEYTLNDIWIHESMDVDRDSGWILLQFLCSDRSIDRLSIVDLHELPTGYSAIA